MNNRVKEIIAEIEAACAEAQRVIDRANATLAKYGEKRK